ncbi:MAG: ABC transporter permease subunit [Anaerolineaceae bacterium]|nr:ABC transporter permease subunit [Anaerolineaceae bacterium]
MSQSILPQSINSVPTVIPHKRRVSVNRLRHFVPFLTIIVVLVIWQVVVSAKLYPPFIIPSPLSVVDKAVVVIGDGSLLRHTLVTFANVVAGLLVGLALGVSLGYLIAKTPFLEDFLSPIIVAVQSAPVVAYAPLLVIWFGSGPTSKIVTGALIVFFPMLMNTIVGIRTVPQPLRDLMLSMRATRWQTFSKLEVPAAMPVLIGGLKISATLAVIGAVVGEFISANAGLGFLVNLARSQYDTPLVIISVLTLTLIARLLYGVVSFIERYVLRWQMRSRRS